MDDTKDWGVYPPSPRRKKGIPHVIPMNDLRPHIARLSCPCGPDVDRGGPERDGDVIVHHAWDGRELIEQHGLQ